MPSDLFGEEAPVGQTLKGIAGFSKEVGDCGFNRVEVTFLFGDVLQVKVRQVLSALKAFSAGPLFPNLLEQ